MLQRFDRNGNGMIDMDERDGPVGFILERLKRENPGLDTSRPIPLSKITEGFQQMRSGGSRDGRSSEQVDPLETQLLVPGFGIPSELMPAPVLGFGPAAELFEVDVRPEDIQEAEERLRRYDRDRDGVLTESEMRRFDGNPMDFDRNKDGKLTASELAIRYARRRQGREENENRQRYTTGRRDERRNSRDEETPDPHDGRKSLRLGSNRDAEGIPDWFIERDSDGDGQIMMNEYTTRWTDELVDEFFEFDVNQDGTITANEAVLAKSDGSSPRAAPPDRSTDSSAMASRSESSSTDDSRRSTSSAPPGEISERNLKYAERIIARNDENNDGALVASEWEGMLIDPQPADADGDGRVTVQEYAGWLQNRQN